MQRRQPCRGESLDSHVAEGTDRQRTHHGVRGQHLAVLEPHRHSVVDLDRSHDCPQPQPAHPARRPGPAAGRCCPRSGSWIPRTRRRRCHSSRPPRPCGVPPAGRVVHSSPSPRRSGPPRTGASGRASHRCRATNRSRRGDRADRRRGDARGRPGQPCATGPKAASAVERARSGRPPSTRVDRRQPARPRSDSRSRCLVPPRSWGAAPARAPGQGRYRPCETRRSARRPSAPSGHRRGAPGEPGHPACCGLPNTPLPRRHASGRARRRAQPGRLQPR